MFSRPNASSGMPIYLQLMDQAKHAIETGAMRPGDQLPGIRKVSEDLVINPNTVAKVYRELEHDGVIELRHGAGAFVAQRGHERMRAEKLRRALPIIKHTVEKLTTLRLTEEEMRRMFEAELIRLRESQPAQPDGRKG